MGLMTHQQGQRWTKHLLTISSSTLLAATIPMAPLNYIIHSQRMFWCIRGALQYANYLDAAFLLTVGGFLLTVELFCSQLCLGAFLLAA